MSPAASTRSRTPACETAAAIRTRGRLPGASSGSVGRPQPRARGARRPSARRRRRARDRAARPVPASRSTQVATSRKLSGQPPPAADASELHVPGGEAVGREIDAEIGHQRPVVLRLPVPAVDDDRHPERSGPAREEELSELARVAAVGVRRAGHARDDAPGRIRTCGLALRRRALYPLSYGRGEEAV